MNEDDVNEPDLGDRILAVWPGAAAPPDFVDEVLAAASGPPAPSHRRGRRVRVVGAIAVAAAVAVALFAFAVAGRGAEPTSGARVADHRETLRIGERAVAVAEPGAALAWRVQRDASTVEQSRGSVFYRVDRGDAPFSVTTPLGRIAVLGTCFAIDVTAQRAIVTVYEGTVAIENEHGAARFVAGDHAVLAPGRGPSAVALLRPALPDEESTAAAMPAPSPAAPAAEPGSPPPNKYADFTRDELAWMARTCQVRYDIPGYAYETTWTVSNAKAAELGLSDAEREAIDRINHQGDSELLEYTRDLLVELTGDRAVAEALEPRTLQHEIMLKSLPGDEERARQRLSAERAGLVRPPDDVSTGPPVERLLRRLVAAGDQYQQRLAAVLGPQRAAQLRRLRAGMASRAHAGCPRD